MRRLSAGRHHRLTSLALVLLWASAAGARAQAQDEILLLDLCLNTRCSGVAAVIIRDGRVLIDREALLAAGLDPTALAAEQVGGRGFVEAAALGRGIDVRVDRDNLRVDLTQRAEDMPAQTLDLRTRDRADPAAQPWTAFVNYAVGVGDAQGGRDAGLESVFLDAAAGRGPAALRSTAFWDPDNGWRRGLSRIELDQTAHLRRWTLGDQVAVAGDPLGGGTLLGGIGVARAFDQDPYLVTFPQPFYQGVIETPGVVEVYANGALIGRREVGAGPINLQNLGVPPGRSDVRVVIRDPFGNRRELSTATYYGGSALLAPGLSDYALRLGVVRGGGGLDDDYGDTPAWQGWYRRGVSDRLTLGARSEGDDAFANVGVDATLRTDLGEFGVALARSRDEVAGAGDGVSLSYSYGGPRMGLSLGARRFSAAYRNLGSPFDLLGARLREDDYANLSWSPLTQLSLQLGHGRQRREGLGAERNTSFGATWRVSSWVQMLFMVQRSQGLFEDTSALLSLNIALARDSLAFNVRDQRLRGIDGAADSRNRGYGIDARRSRPVDTGWGYDVSLQHDGFGDSGFGQVEYQGRHGRYALQMDHFGGRTGGRLLANGALVAIGGRAYATPPLETGFALVRVPDVAGVPILRENLEVGRTDARGDLLVRGLIPYYANRIALDPAQVPLAYEIVREAGSLSVFRNTGSVATLEARPLHAVSGRIAVRDAQGTRPVAFGLLQLEHEGAEHRSPLGSEGRFYFERLPPGRYRASVDSDGARAWCRIEIPPPSGAGIRDLGVIECTPTTRGEP
ncbi:fimbrial biogenesis outer membrane usher protein [Luteimonas viscosa]|uniref:Fimbrial biogenesis outer membrane usher protein n=1 Tax=Luteimonas viscosa TaxID=1132694 RepID=A0A5D4XTG3_9GAMM|nr:fimbria/pilus outer membrane usher protein [Luteimonas viscosa]TYT26282.1 fimbrial biogenesis outer membrane usher protein [Luteimonas viscosa]